MSNARDLARAEIKDRLGKLKKVKSKWEKPKYNSKRQATKVILKFPQITSSQTTK